MIDGDSGASEIQVESRLVPKDILIWLRSQESGLGHSGPPDTESTQKWRVEPVSRWDTAQSSYLITSHNSSGWFCSSSTSALAPIPASKVRADGNRQRSTGFRADGLCKWTRAKLLPGEQRNLGRKHRMSSSTGLPSGASKLHGPGGKSMSLSPMY